MYVNLSFIYHASVYVKVMERVIRVSILTYIHKCILYLYVLDNQLTKIVILSKKYGCKKSSYKNESNLLKMYIKIYIYNISHISHNRFDNFKLPMGVLKAALRVLLYGSYLVVKFCVVNIFLLTFTVNRMLCYPNIIL